MLRSRAEALRANSARETAEKIEVVRQQLDRIESLLEQLLDRQTAPDPTTRPQIKKPS